MADEKQGGAIYGYASDETKVSPYHFGLNAGVTTLQKLEWIPNGGKSGAEGQALDMVFNINGGERGYRMFPVTKGYDKAGREVTDPTSKEFQDEVLNFNAKMTHIMSCFIDREAYIAALQRPIEDFKKFCKIIESMLPKNFRDIKLDVFMQYQNEIKEGQSMTFLELPKNMKHGRWICPAMEGSWIEKRLENPSDDAIEALWYEREDGKIDEATGKVAKHVFVRRGWFMNHNLAKQQRNEKASNSNGGTATSAAAVTTPLPEQGKAVKW